jgi:hypothetical protein
MSGLGAPVSAVGLDPGLRRGDEFYPSPTFHVGPLPICDGEESCAEGVGPGEDRRGGVAAAVEEAGV